MTDVPKALSDVVFTLCDISQADAVVAILVRVRPDGGLSTAMVAAMAEGSPFEQEDIPGMLEAMATEAATPPDAVHHIDKPEVDA